MRVRLYRCRSFDEPLNTWSTRSHRYTLEQISAFARSEPILDDYEDVELPSSEQQDRNLTGFRSRTGQIMDRRIRVPNRLHGRRRRW